MKPARLFLPLGVLTGISLLGYPSPLPAFTTRAGLLPQTTTAFVEIPNLPQLQEAWRRTPYGALEKAPSLEAFRDDLRDRLEKGTVELFWLAGLTPAEITEAGAGALTIALAREGDEEPAAILLLDVKEHADKARAVLERCGKRLSKLGARRSTPVLAGTAAVVYDLERGAGGKARQYVHVVKDDLLIAATQRALAEGALHRMAGTRKESLAQAKAFQAATVRAEKEVPDSQLRWFVEPLALWQDLRILTSAEPEKGPDVLKTYQEEGFNAIQGVGGAASVGTATHEVFARAYVYAPRPYRRAMRMADLPNASPSAPPPWVPARVASFMTLSVRVREAFHAYGPLFDAQYGEGEKGAFEDILTSTRDDFDGPRVDVRKEIIDRCKPPLLFLDTVSADGRRILSTLSVQVKESSKVAGAIDRLFKGDEDATQLSFGENGLWEIKSGKGAGKGNRAAEAPRSTSGLAVNKGYLFLADSAATLKDLFGKAPPLSEDAEYRRIRDELIRVGEKEACLRLFYRLCPNVRVAYQALRSGKVREEDPLLARALRTLLLTPSGEGEAIDRGKLPDFERLQRHFPGAAGALAVSIADGWSVIVVVPRAAAPRESQK